MALASASGPIVDIRPAVFPTLFIGLGGTGCDVLTKLRRRMLAREWNGKSLSSIAEYPYAEFLFADADAQYCGRRDGAQGSSLAEPSADEWLTLRRGFLDKYFDKEETLDRYPHIRTWFPMSFAQVREWINLCEERSNNHSPTPAPRCFARLAFFDSYPEIRGRITAALRRLKMSRFDAEAEALGLVEAEHRFRIIIVASAFGNTGSGLLFDMGWLTRKLASQEFSGLCRTDLVLTLPGDSSRENRHEATAYATLMELDSIMSGRCRLAHQWEPYEYDAVDESPFRDVYLISERNMAGVEMRSFGVLHDMLADSLFEELKGSVLAEKRYRVANCHTQFKFYPHRPALPQDLGKVELRYHKGYSSFGFAKAPCSTFHIGGHAEVPKTVEDGLGNHQFGAQTQQLSAWLDNAMPFVDARMDSDFTPSPGAYMHVVSVSAEMTTSERDNYKEIESQLTAGLPTQFGLNRRGINLVFEREKGCSACYSELSGFPLGFLRYLEQWRRSYEMTRGTNGQIGLAYLHINRDTTIFPDPVVPTVGKLIELLNDAKLFLQAVILRVVKRNPKPTMPDGCYLFEVLKGDLRSIGNERAIRMNGLPVEYRSQIDQAVTATLGQLKAVQLKALLGLAHFLAHETYTPTLDCDESGVERSARGFMNVVARELADDFAKLAHDKDLSESDSRGVEGGLCNSGENWEELRQSFDKWTEVIPDSARDGFVGEVREPDPDGSDRSKRRVKKEFFDAAWLKALLRQADDGDKPVVCAGCGMQLLTGGHFCSYCGHKVA